MAHYHNYGIKYKGSFSSIPMLDSGSITYDVIIFKKNYSDTIYPLTFAANPVIHTFLEDEPKPAIKGSELELNIISLNGEIALKDFYSENDDEYRILFKQKSGQNIFLGYLIQTDCEEIQTDIAHELKLVFNDQLGLLKDISFDLAVKRAEYTTAGMVEYDGFIEFPITSNYQTVGNKIIVRRSIYAVPGNSIIIEVDGETIGVYKILDVQMPILDTYHLYVDSDVPVYSTSGILYAKFYIVDSLDLNGLYSLGNILSVCLQNTGFSLPAIYAGSMEVEDSSSVLTSDLFTNLKVFLTTFSNENNYDSAYDVVEKIMDSLGCTLFQSLGQWCIVRYNELRYYDNDIPYRLYTSLFDYTGNGANLIQVRDIGDGTNIEQGLNGSIIRPLRYVQNTFKYNKRELIDNSNLDKIGKQVGTFFPTGKIIKRYEVVDWEIDPSTPANTVFIQYDYDTNNNLLDKYLYITETSLPSAPSSIRVSTNKIYVIAGDRATFNIEYKHPTGSPPSGITAQIKIILTDGVNTKYFCKDGLVPDGWYNTNRNVNIDSNIEKTDYDNFSVDILPFPFSGALYIVLTPFGRVPGSGFGNLETKYKNFELGYTDFYGGSSKANGQRHTNKWYFNIKEIQEKDIFLDVVNRPSIRGSLLLALNSSTGITQYASVFTEGFDPTEYKLGQILVGQEHNWRDRIRLKFEGNMWPINKLNGTQKFINPLTILQYQQTENKYYAFGKIDINYRANTYNGTIYEMWDSETDADSIENGISSDPRKIYNFEYLYNEK